MVFRKPHKIYNKHNAISASGDIRGERTWVTSIYLASTMHSTMFPVSHLHTSAVFVFLWKSLAELTHSTGNTGMWILTLHKYLRANLPPLAFPLGSYEEKEKKIMPFLHHHSYFQLSNPNSASKRRPWLLPQDLRGWVGGFNYRVASWLPNSWQPCTLKS